MSPPHSLLESGRRPRVPISSVVAFCGSMSAKPAPAVGLRSEKVGGSVLRLMLPKTCQLGSTSQIRPSLGFRRSEEHTSELQSLMRISYAIFCLKKKHKTGPQ